MLAERFFIRSLIRTFVTRNEGIRMMGPLKAFFESQLSQNIAGGYLDPLVGGGLKEVVPFIIVLLILMIKPHGLFGSKGIERV